MSLIKYGVQALCLSLLFLLASCRNSNAPISEKSIGQASEVNVTLEGEEAENLRAMSFLLDTKRPVLKMTEGPMNSVVVISNKAGTKKYYVELVWNKTAGENHLYVKNLEIKTDVFGVSLAMNTTEEWYISGYVGGTFDKQTKHVSFKPNNTKLQAVTVGGQVQKSVPVYFPWIRLDVKQVGSKLYASTPKDRKISFAAMGMLMRVELKNAMDYTTRVKSITYQSNVLRTGEGYYDLNTLPAVGATTLPEWKSLSDQEPTYTFVDEDGTTALVPEMQGNTTYNKYFLVWGAPRAAARPVTHVLANAVRVHNGVEQKYPQMQTLYIWGSTNVPKDGTRRILRTSIIRPKMALEYFGEGYVGLNPKAENPAHKTTTYDQGIGTYTHAQINASGFLHANWFVPDVQDACGLFMNVGEYLKFENQATPGPHHSEQSIRVNGQAKLYRDTYWNGSPTIYALRFQNTQNTDKYQYSAFRYTLEPGGSYPYNIKGIRIEAVYLGPHYKGNLEDVRKSDFWNFHKTDYVSRFYPPVVAADASGSKTQRYFYPMTWVRGSSGGYNHLCWGWGVSKDNLLNGVLMSPVAVIDRTKLPSHYYWDIKTSVIPVQRAGTLWVNN